jgi:hypothetical protein
VERCLACEADSGWHRSAVTFRQAPVKVVVSKAYHYAHPFLCALYVAAHVNSGCGDPYRPRKRGNAPRVPPLCAFIRGSSTAVFSGFYFLWTT